MATKKNKVKYSDELKLQAGEMFESGMTAKQISIKLGVPQWVAFYLEYKGRELKGSLPKKMPFTPRPNGKHKHSKREQETLSTKLPETAHMWETKQVITPLDVVEKNVKQPSDFEVQDFVENNIHPVPTHSKFTGFALLLVGVALIAYALTH